MGITTSRMVLNKQIALICLIIILVHASQIHFNAVISHFPFDFINGISAQFDTFPNALQ
jgi:hypothetical protein